jgi:hypothetical protein
MRSITAFCVSAVQTPLLPQMRFYMPICNGCPCVDGLQRLCWHLLDCTVAAVVGMLCVMQIFVFFPDAAKVGVKDIKVSAALSSTPGSP